jgi:hypothetical protein
VLGDVVSDAPMLLVCNRGRDSLFAMLALKAASFSRVQHVGGGMFTWRDVGLPTDSDPGLVNMPAAQDADEEAILKRLGYGTDGKPACGS